MRTELLRFNGAVERDPAIDGWMKEHAGELGAIALQWFEVMRKCDILKPISWSYVCAGTVFPESERNHGRAEP